MIEYDIKYLTEKEAAQRYRRSRSWFQTQRSHKEGPRCYKLNGKGPVYYPLEETDKWFRENMREE
jgi:hypothetical protein